MEGPEVHHTDVADVQEEVGHQVEDHSCGSFDWEVVDLDSSEEVVDLVPCYVVGDGQVGLEDLVVAYLDPCCIVVECQTDLVDQVVAYLVPYAAEVDQEVVYLWDLQEDHLEEAYRLAYLLACRL